MPRAYRPRGIPLVRHYVRKRTYSTSDRILIHLSTDALRPEEQTQEGIAAATRCGRSTLTKWLDRLEQRRVVTRSRIRLDTCPLPKYAYRLTEPGWRLASELRKRVVTQVVKVRTPNLGDLHVRLSEVSSLVPARLDLTGAVAAIHKETLDLTQAVPSARRRETLVWGSGLRRVDRFFGRRYDLLDLDRWWSSKSRVLLVTGLAGIGKSTLVAAWVQGRRLSLPVYGFEIRRSSTPAGLLTDLGMFLAAIGKPALATHLAQGVPIGVAFVSRLLHRDLPRTGILIVIDNVDQAGRSLGRLVDELFLRAEVKLPVRLVPIGRKVPQWLEAATVRGNGIEVHQVRGLDVAASKALLASRGIGSSKNETREIIRRARGHPLLLQLAATSGLRQRSGAQRYLEEEVWDSLSSADRSVLETASLFRKGVSERILEQVAKTHQRTLEELLGRGLLERTVAGEYEVHDVLREFVERRLPAARRQRLHARAAEALLNATDSRERWEGIFHLIAAGKASDAATILDTEGAALLDSVAAEEIAPLVRDLTLKESEPSTYCSFAEALGDSLRIRGHVGPALFQYGHARRLAEGSGEAGRIPRLLRKMAFLERCRNRYARAQGYLVEAQARLARSENRLEKTEVLRELALVEQAFGNLTNASAHLSEAVDLATEASDRGALSRSLLALGSLETQQGHPERGLDYCAEGLRVAERSGNLTEIARAHVVMGTSLQELGRVADSFQHYERGLEIARLLGNLRLTAYATLNRTGSLISLSRYKEAGGALQEARGLLNILEEQDALAILKTYEAHLQIGLGHWSRAKDAWDEAIRLLRRYASPWELALALKETGEFYADLGDTTVARRYLLEARTVALRLSNAKLSSDIERALGLSSAPTVHRSTT